jgi:tetratricopeptide (TPR) repeat protein
VEALLRAGITAAKSGQRERARDLLMRVVEQDEENVSAWLWLSGVVDSLDDREVCLENVLALDPDHGMARKGLAMVHKQRVDSLLREGIAAAKSGQRERARDTLMRVVEQDEENVSAWLWLSGVMDGLDDREVCLENVLALDPNHEAARRGLDLVRKQRGARASSSAEVGPVSPTVPNPEPPSVLPPASPPPQASVYSPPAPEPGPFLPSPPAAADTHSSPIPEPAPSSSSLSGDLDDEYLCPYCAAPTAPQDRRCKTCDGKLWISFRKREKRSFLLWVALVLQALSVIQTAGLSVVLSFIVFGFGGREASAMGSEVVGIYAALLGVSVATVEMWARAAFVAALLMSLFSLALLIGLYLRWKPAFYLFLVNAVLGFLSVVVNVFRTFLSPSPEAAALGGVGYVCAGAYVLIALILLGLAFQLKDDFPFEKRRILLRVDPDVVTGPMMLARGHEYVGRKMWGLAALHMRRAVARMPGRMEGRASLTLAYLRLKRYDLADRALEEARRINPDDPQVEELQTLLDDLRAAHRSPRRT